MNGVYSINYRYLSVEKKLNQLEPIDRFIKSVALIGRKLNIMFSIYNLLDCKHLTSKYSS